MEKRRLPIYCARRARVHYIFEKCRKYPRVCFDIAVRIVYHLTMLTKAEAVSIKTGFFPSREVGVCADLYRADFRLQSM